MSRDLSDHILGIDHLSLLTPQVDLLSKMYSDALGFTLGPSGILPEQKLGFQQIVFSEGGFLEIIGPQQDQKPERLESRFGPGSLALSVKGIDDVFSKLTKWDCTVSRPAEGTTSFAGVEKPPKNLWSAIGFMETAVPGDCIYFMERNAEAWKQLIEKNPQLQDKSLAIHKNTAKRIAAIWILALDHQDASDMLKEIGLNQGREIEFKMLDLVGIEFKTGSTKLFVMQPSDVERFIQTAGNQSSEELEGIIGLSLEVDDLSRAQEVIRQGTRIEFRPYEGPLGKSILLHPDVTGGLLLELFNST